MTSIKKRIINITLIFVLLFATTVNASVLGSTNIYDYSYEIGDGLELHKNQFYSDQSGVERQTENYFHYKPNPATRPIVTVGNYVHGGETLTDCYNILKKNGRNILGGVNGDFFSLQTGVPMGHVVIDKEIVSTDERVLPAIGFRENGTAFINDFSIITTMTYNGTTITIPFINKYFQKWGFYLFNSKYHTTVQPTTQANYITMDIKSGNVELGGTIKAVVSNVEKNVADKALKEGQLVLGLTNDADLGYFEIFDTIPLGTEVTLNFSSNNDELWKSAKYILASEAGQIMKNSKPVGNLSGGAAPRTAVGITKEGNIIFYTIDGRQQGYSYGIKLTTLSDRMAELGCVDVLNLDGGGSTSIGAIYGGTDKFSLENKPSDGSQRRDSTYVFFENMSYATGKTQKVFVYPSKMYIKSGSKANFEFKAADNAYLPTKLSGAFKYEIDGTSTVDANGLVTAVGEGESTFKVNVDGVSGSAIVKSVTSPQIIEFYDEKTRKQLLTLSMNKGDSINLNAKGYFNLYPIISQDTSYVWDILDKNVGTIAPDGILTITTDKNIETNVTVNSGKTTAKIPLTVNNDIYNKIFCDISSNWAKSYIHELYYKGIVNGSKGSDGKNYFYPQNLVTRSEMAVMLGKSYGEDISVYNSVVLPFADVLSIPDWAIGYVKLLYQKGVVKGSDVGGKTYFNPTAGVSRSEIFTIIGRKLNLSGGTPCPFVDRNEIPLWAVSYIDALYAKGMVNGYDGNLIKPHNNITRAEITKIISKSITEQKQK